MISVRFLGIATATASVLLAASPAPAQGANGMTLFNQRCKMCHSVAASGPAVLGPNLKGVVDRKSGITAFKYSPAMKNAGLVWNKATLDRYLTSPAKTVPGGKMVISVTDAAQRKAIIDYLATQR